MSQLRVKDWERFQHYKNRKPPWIKFYTEIIEEFKDDGTPNDLFALSDSAKLTLLLAWLLASHFGGNLPDRDAAWYGQRLGIRAVNLKEVIEAGFIYLTNQDDTVDASNLASDLASTNLQPCLHQSKSKSKKLLSCETRPRVARARVSYSEAFEAFWQVYPRPVNKGAAWKAWQKIAEPVPTLDDLRSVLQMLASSRQWQEDGGRFIPHPSTWLNARGWESRIGSVTQPPRTPDRIERLAAEDTVHRGEPGFDIYKRAVLDGETNSETFEQYQKEGLQ